MFAALDAMHAQEPITRLAHGACGWDRDRPATCTPDKLEGADRWAHEWATERGVPVQTYAAKWTAQGRSAGPRRNGEMLHQERPNVVVAFPGARGTADLIRQAESMRLRVTQVGK